MCSFFFLLQLDVVAANRTTSPIVSRNNLWSPSPTAMVEHAHAGGHHHDHHHIFAASYQVLEICCGYISFLGAFVCVAGVVLSMLNLATAVYNLAFGAEIKMIGISDFENLQKASFMRVRLQLGAFTALGLEILVVADVLETLTKHVEEMSYESLGKLCAIAAFRTVLAYFLGLEIKEVMEIIEEEEEHLHKHLHHDHAEEEEHEEPATPAPATSKHSKQGKKHKD